MLNLFTVIVYIHVVAAILWVGSAVVLEILEWEATHASKRERLAATLHRGSWFGLHVFAPAALLTILTGVIAVAVGRPTFGQLWVILALVAVVIVSAMGGGVIGRTSAMLEERLKDPAVSEEEIEAKLAGIRPFVYLDLALLFFILFDMVVRPVTFDPAFLITTGVFFLAVLAGIGYQARRR